MTPDSSPGPHTTLAWTDYGAVPLVVFGVDERTADDFAANPSPRILAAEARRDMRRLLDAGSFGTPGARVMRRRGGREEPLTAAERAAVCAEFADLERSMSRAR